MRRARRPGSVEPEHAGGRKGESAARAAVASLIADGSHTAHHAAAIIQNDLDRQIAAVALPPAERTAILTQLEEPTEGLAELRGALLRDLHDPATG